MSNTIPDDVMDAARKAYDCLVTPWRDDIIEISNERAYRLIEEDARFIAGLILSERKRCAAEIEDWKSDLSNGEIIDNAIHRLAARILNPPSSLPRSSPAETTPDAALLPASGTHSDWITWNGGECPVETGTVVDLRFRDFDLGTHRHIEMWEQPAEFVRWDQRGLSSDIIAYRIVPANLTQHEASL